MNLETRKYLYDICHAAKLAKEFIVGKTLEDYERDAMLRAAVERQFEIIGEATAQLARADKRTVDCISYHQRIIAFRNVLIHGYADVDDRLVWNVVETYLPTLIHEVEALLCKSDE